MLPANQVAWVAMAGNDLRRVLDSAEELNITFIGRKTGRRFSTPVWFVKEGEKLYLLPVNGTSSNWYRNILKNPKMEFEVEGKKAASEARPVKDKKRILETIARFSTKYGAADVKRYYSGQDVAVELLV